MPKMMRGQKRQPTVYLNMRKSCRLRVVSIFLRDSRASETRARVSPFRLRRFSRAFAFRSLRYPWGKIRTTRSPLVDILKTSLGPQCDCHDPVDLPGSYISHIIISQQFRNRTHLTIIDNESKCFGWLFASFVYPENWRAIFNANTRQILHRSVSMCCTEVNAEN